MGANLMALYLQSFGLNQEEAAYFLGLSQPRISRTWKLTPAQWEQASYTAETLKLLAALRNGEKAPSLQLVESARAQLLSF